MISKTSHTKNTKKKKKIQELRFPHKIKHKNSKLQLNNISRCTINIHVCSKNFLSKHQNLHKHFKIITLLRPRDSNNLKRTKKKKKNTEKSPKNKKSSNAKKKRKKKRARKNRSTSKRRRLKYTSIQRDTNFDSCVTSACWRFSPFSWWTHGSHVLPIPGIVTNELRPVLGCSHCCDRGIMRYRADWPAVFRNGTRRDEKPR